MKWITRVKPNTLVPNGICLKEDTRDGLSELCLLLPLLPIWRSRKYDIDWDRYKRGWYVLKFFAAAGVHTSWFKETPNLQLRFLLSLAQWKVWEVET